MKIGLDLTVIQTPHRMRGIGSTALNFVNHIPSEVKENHRLIIFLFEELKDDALMLLDLNKADYEIRYVEKVNRINIPFTGKLKKINSPLNGLRTFFYRHLGDPRFSKQDLSDLDVYFQFDQM
jgi:hypothetical protein